MKVAFTPPTPIHSLQSTVVRKASVPFSCQQKQKQRSRPTTAALHLPRHHHNHNQPQQQCQHHHHQQQQDRNQQQPQQQPTLPLGPYGVDTKDLQTDAVERLRAFVKTRASLDPTHETIFHFTGTVYATPPNSPTIPLFYITGFNVSRALPIDNNGHRLLTREVALYLDLDSKTPLTTFHNPYTNTTNSVIPVFNDPVNQQLLPQTAPITHTPLTSQTHAFTVDVFPRYPSPLPVSTYPDVGTHNDTYSSAELFTFLTSPQTLRDPTTPTVDECTLTWSRVGPWLPWMRMGDQEGVLTYHCRGMKLPGGFADLPDDLRRIVQTECPHFQHAPQQFTTPNETSWSYMRKLIEQRGFPRADGRVARPSNTAGSPPPTTRTATTDTASNEGKNKEMHVITREQLSQFRSTKAGDTKVPIYLCVAGKVFDVSAAREHYEFGETYHSLTGCDATHAFLRGDLSFRGGARGGDDVRVDMGSLTDKEKETLQGWVDWLASKYEQVAVLKED